MGKRGRALTATAVLAVGICGTIVVTNAVTSIKYVEQKIVFYAEILMRRFLLYTMMSTGLEC